MAERSITISINNDGNVEVKGFLSDEPLALWMLEKAKDGIKQMHKPKIQPAGGIMRFARGRR